MLDLAEKMITETVKLKNGVTERDHISGAADAPVTLLEYGNFECIHCGRAFPIIKEVQKRLGDNLRFVFRHFPTVQTHPHSLRAAEAVEAAGAQGKFWEMYDQLFMNQQSWSQAPKPEEMFKQYASQIGLDATKYQADFSIRHR